MHRRRFLQQSALGASALTLGSALGAANRDPGSAPRSGRDDMGVGSEPGDSSLHTTGDDIVPGGGFGEPGSDAREAASDGPDTTATPAEAEFQFGPRIRKSRELDLSPANWIWYPSRRVLQNTVILFRKPLRLDGPVKSATGWILGDSRYRLFINGKRVQWGPAPSDPRFSEADPLDLTALLQPGDNVIGAEVLYFGQGDGTWPIGKPGFIFKLDLQFEDDTHQTILSDPSWQTHLARSWKPGQYKRWYLRAFQEEFDGRLYPLGWTSADFAPDEHWLPALVSGTLANRPAICTNLPDYLYDSDGDKETSQLRRRQVPMLREETVFSATLAEATRITWKRPPEEYFESLTPDAFEADRETPVARESGDGRWTVDAVPEGAATALAFSFPEHLVGWPFFTITAPEGTIVEMMVHEAHRVGGPALLNTRFHSWTRFVCREGVNTFEPFDFESLRWLQLHIRKTGRPVTVEAVGVRRRIYPWPHEAEMTCSDAALTTLFGAGLNTLVNAAQDTIVDCMGRERQQYSGDIGHVLHATMNAYGAVRQAQRYVDTYSQGLMNAGYYLDSWPAYDRLARLPQRELQLSKWGPLLDHGVGHVLDCFHTWMWSGELEPLAEAYARHLRFFDYLLSIRGEDGLLPVDGLGTPWVWIDHDAYRMQRHKLCAWNLYAAGMTRHALAPLARAFGDASMAADAEMLSTLLGEAVNRHFFSRTHGTFVVNLPWLEEEGGSVRYCDRSLATALLFDLLREEDRARAADILAGAPEEMGFSYPANAGWRLWALAKEGRMDVVLSELRSRWATMRSVLENNSLSENWEPGYDDSSQWSHAPVAPVYLMYQGVAGIRPLEPGFARYEVRPQPGDLTSFRIVNQTPKGPIRLEIEGAPGARRMRLETPPDAVGELVLDLRTFGEIPPARPDLPVLGTDRGGTRFALPAGTEVVL